MALMTLNWLEKRPEKRKKHEKVEVSIGATKSDSQFVVYFNQTEGTKIHSLTMDEHEAQELTVQLLSKMSDTGLLQTLSALFVTRKVKQESRR